MRIELDQEGLNARARKNGAEVQTHDIAADEAKLEKLQNENSAYESEVHDLRELYFHQKDQAKRLREQRNRILNSKSYKIGKLITYPFRRAYRIRAVHRPLRFLYYLTYPSKKRILGGSEVTYGDLYKSPKSKTFYLKGRHGVPLKQLKVAAIMDDFTYTAFMHECELKQLTPENWKQEIEEFQPDLLFVESAWRGKDEKWREKISRGPQHLLKLVRYCQEQGIPTAFWNKEDPAHTAVFLPVASMFDFVFTTDLDCIPVYRDVLCHERVFLLPFAAQPQINNPVEAYERKDMFNFAGSYYAKYKERCENFNSLVKGILTVKGIDIFDRNANRSLNHKYRFPPELQQYVRGSLPYSEIDKAYKGYMHAININTIKYSPSMFARRAFELLASNTITVSNYSLGIKNILGGLVISSDDGSEAVKELKKVIKSDSTRNAFRLLGLRNVMDRHTYEDRLAYLCQKVFQDYAPERTEKSVVVIAQADSQQDIHNILTNYDNQLYQSKELTIVFTGSEAVELQRSDVKLVNERDVSGESVRKLAGKADYITVFSHDDYYGPHYLQDLVLATKYSKADVIGKSAYYTLDKSKLVRANDGTQYRENQAVGLTRCIVKTSYVGEKNVPQLLQLVKSDKEYSEGTLSIDEFSYCKINNGTINKKHMTEVNAHLDIANGGKLEKLYREAEKAASDKSALRATKIKRLLRLRRTRDFVEEL